MNYFPELNLRALQNKNSKIITFYSHPNKMIAFQKFTKNKNLIFHATQGRIGFYPVFIIHN